MTQAALAEKLGVTNKAVSKWETGEAMPETSLLAPLSDILGVTVDELLNGRRNEGDNFSSAEKVERDGISGHLFTRGKDDPPETALEKLSGVVCAVVMLGGVAVYLIMGAVAEMWHPYWVIIPVCALCCGIIGIVFGLIDGEKRRRKLSEGKNPYTDSFCGIFILVCIITYLLCGALAGLWHPLWAIVVAGAVVDGIVGAVGNYITPKNK